MTVKELIEALSKMPQDMEVMAQDGLDPSDWAPIKWVNKTRSNDPEIPDFAVIET